MASKKSSPAAHKTPTSIGSTHPDRPLKRSLRLALSSYRTVILGMLIATLPPLLLIGLLRWTSDDYTGDQYSIITGVISIFITLLIARIAVAGWNFRQTKIMALYSTVMSRLLSGIGLFIIIALHTIPLVAGVFLMGLGLAGEAARWVVVPGVALLLIGFYLIISVSFAIFSLMEDLSLSVWQSYRISMRLSRRYWKPLLWRSLVAVTAFTLVAVGLTLIGTVAAAYLQDPFIGIIIDGLLSWIITPVVVFYLAIVFKRLVHAYE